MNEKIDLVIGDRYERLAYERVIRNRNEMFYARKDDYLIDMNETNNIFSGHYEIQTILFLVIIIFVIMLTAYHFGNILELKLLFSKNAHNINYNHGYIQCIYLDMHTDLKLY